MSFYPSIQPCIHWNLHPLPPTHRLLGQADPSGSLRCTILELPKRRHSVWRRWNQGGPCGHEVVSRTPRLVITKIISTASAFLKNIKEQVSPRSVLPMLINVTYKSTYRWTVVIEFPAPMASDCSTRERCNTRFQNNAIIIPLQACVCREPFKPWKVTKHLMRRTRNRWWDGRSHKNNLLGCLTHADNSVITKTN